MENGAIYPYISYAGYKNIYAVPDDVLITGIHCITWITYTETDSSTTSDYLYEQYNGTEYELTGTRLDIRVVPDEMDFSGTTPSSTATSETLPLDYHPATFYNSAMQHTNVQLTWDETDPDRQKLLNQDFFNTDIREMDFQVD